MKSIDESIYMVSLDVTYMCNLSCLHCFNHSGEKDTNELSHDGMVELAREIGQLKPYIVCLCGGEPLLKADLVYQLVEEIHKYSPQTLVNMVTNGMLVTDDIAQKLKESGMANVQVSLDGADAESHNWLRNSDISYDRAVSAIETLERAGLNVGVAFTPNKRNYKNVQKAIDMCDGLGVQAFRVQPMMDLGRASDNLQDAFMNHKEYRQFKRLIDRAKLEERAMSIDWGDPTEHLVRVRSDVMDSTYFLSIDPYGNVYVSPYLPIVIGNLKNHSLLEYWEAGLRTIWKRPEMKKLAHMIEDTSLLSRSGELLERLGKEDTEKIAFDLMDADQTTQILQSIDTVVDDIMNA